jgi:hypothetical protein
MQPIVPGKFAGNDGPRFFVRLLNEEGAAYNNQQYEQDQNRSRRSVTPVSGNCRHRNHLPAEDITRIRKFNGDGMDVCRRANVGIIGSNGVIFIFSAP